MFFEQNSVCYSFFTLPQNGLAFMNCTVWILNNSKSTCMVFGVLWLWEKSNSHKSIEQNWGISMSSHETVMIYADQLLIGKWQHALHCDAWTTTHYNFVNMLMIKIHNKLYNLQKGVAFSEASHKQILPCLVTNICKANLFCFR